jgi:DNA replication protein DnaC
VKHEQLQSGLRRLFLHAMGREYTAVAKEHEKSKRSYEQYLASLVDLELADKDRLRTERLIREAKIPLVKHTAEYDYSERKGITAQEVSRLCQGEFVQSAGNVVLYGDMGVGKSHLAMAITRSLCERNFRCLFMSTAAFISELCAAQKNLMLSSLFRRLDRYDLITLDELGYTPQNQEGADLFFQLIAQRYERKSLMITTNLTFSEWDKVFLSTTSTAAAVDRIIHHCETFNIQGPSWRAESAKRRFQKKAKMEIAEV